MIKWLISLFVQKESYKIAFGDWVESKPYPKDKPDYSGIDFPINDLESLRKAVDILRRNNE